MYMRRLIQIGSCIHIHTPAAHTKAILKKAGCVCTRRGDVCVHLALIRGTQRSEFIEDMLRLLLVRLLTLSQVRWKEVHARCMSQANTRDIFLHYKSECGGSTLTSGTYVCVAWPLFYMANPGFSRAPHELLTGSSQKDANHA